MNINEHCKAHDIPRCNACAHLYNEPHRDETSMVIHGVSDTQKAFALKQLKDARAKYTVGKTVVVTNTGATGVVVIDETIDSNWDIVLVCLVNARFAKAYTFQELELI